MVVQLLQPMMLWGLLGLAVPLAIHLLHKRSQRVIKVGSLHTFRGGTPVQARHVKLNQTGLLLLRCLMLTLLVLLLAQPVVFKKEEQQKRYLFIAPELAAQLDADSLKAKGYEARLLQPGLPLLAGAVKADSSRYSYWDVFREIDMLKDAGDTVWLRFYPTLNRFSGDRPLLSKVYQPLAVPERKVQQHFIKAVQQPGQQLALQYWLPQQGVWKYQRKTVPAADSVSLKKYSSFTAPQQQDTLRLVLHHSREYTNEAMHWTAALQIIDSMWQDRVIKLENISDPEQFPAKGADVWVWLSEAEPPAAVGEQNFATRFRLSKEKKLEWFAPDLQDHGLILIHHSLQDQRNNRSMLAAFLPALLEVLPNGSAAGTPPILLSEMQWQPQKGTFIATAGREEGESFEIYFWVLLILVFIIERWLSLQK